MLTHVLVPAITSLTPCINVFTFICLLLFFFVLAAVDMSGRPIPGKHWLQLDLQQEYAVSRLLLDWEDGYSDTYTLQVYVLILCFGLYAVLDAMTNSGRVVFAWVSLCLHLLRT